MDNKKWTTIFGGLHQQRRPKLELVVSKEEGDKRIGEKSKGKRSGHVFIVYCQ